MENMVSGLKSKRKPSLQWEFLLPEEVARRHTCDACFCLRRGSPLPTPCPCSLAHTVEEFTSRLDLQISYWLLGQTLSALLMLQSLYGTLLKPILSGLLCRMPAFP